jgi:hypothetical protein
MGILYRPGVAPPPPPSGHTASLRKRFLAYFIKDPATHTPYLLREMELYLEV